MSSLMLAGCRTYPHWPLDMNKAWFICMGLSGEHRQEIQEMKETLCTFHELHHHPPPLMLHRKPLARGPGSPLGNTSAMWPHCGLCTCWGHDMTPMHNLPNYPVLHGSPPSFPPFFSFPCADCSVCQTPCEMLEFTEGMKKPAGKKRQVVCWCAGELNRLTAGFGKGQGKRKAGLHGRSRNGSWGKARRAASWTQTMQPAGVPSLGLHRPLWHLPCLPCLSPGTWGTPCLLSISSCSHGTTPSLSPAPWLNPALWSTFTQVSLPAEPFPDPEPLPAPHLPGAGAQQVAWTRHRAPQEPAPSLLPSPGVWKLSATSWLPQIHMGRGS